MANQCGSSRILPEDVVYYLMDFKMEGGQPLTVVEDIRPILRRYTLVGGHVCWTNEAEDYYLPTITCCNPLGMKCFCTLTIPENFFECWLQITRCNSKRRLESRMGQKKKFSSIWFGAPLGKPEASATWKRCLEILMGWGAWEECLRGC